MPRMLLLSVSLCLAVISLGATIDRPSAPITLSSPAFVTYLAEYDFEDGFGGPDPQGWTTVDRTVPEYIFTHVDDFVGLLPPYAPIEGNQSLWIGARPSPERCTYEFLPGYGNAWYEIFESVDFPTAGDVTISYSLHYDTEASYDFLFVDYFAKSGNWRNLVEYTGPFPGAPVGGIGPIVESHTAPAESLDASARFRFRFSSDGAVSDQDGYFGSTDGAATIDSITISDDNGVVDYQDFESEALNAQGTVDGDWQAGVTEFFGDFGGLVNGNTVLQEDTVTMNTGHFWSFFNGSPDTYVCGGFAGQAAVPLEPTNTTPEIPMWLSNGAVSPILDLTVDKNGDPTPGPPDELAIEFDVYFDPVPSSYVYFNVAVKAFRDECLEAFWWNQYPPNGDNPTKTWSREQVIFNIPNNTTHVQVMLFAEADRTQGEHTCHSHSPMFDNVEINGHFDTVTGAGEPRASGYALHDNVPNPFNPSTTISYDVADGGGHVTLRIYDVSGRLVRTLVDQNQGPGRKSVAWKGDNDQGGRVASGVYFYRMSAPGFTETKRMVLLK